MEILPVKPDGLYSMVVRRDAAFHAAIDELYRQLTPSLPKINFVAAPDLLTASKVPNECRHPSTYTPPLSDTQFEITLGRLPRWLVSGGDDEMDIDDSEPEAPSINRNGKHQRASIHGNNR